MAYKDYRYVRFAASVWVDTSLRDWQGLAVLYNPFDRNKGISADPAKLRPVSAKDAEATDSLTGERLAAGPGAKGGEVND